MTRVAKTFFTLPFWLTLFAVGLLLVPIQHRTALAAFDAHEEKVEPEFTREADTIIARLIPRAKSTSVLIAFEAAGGRLRDVAGVDFKEVARPEVDHKDFKSALFVAGIENIARGAEVRLSITSDFFSSSTEYWIFNEKSENPWMNSGAENTSLSDRVRGLVVKVRDGGRLDADGAADGRITIIGGPKDSFWGYALGTLFIRFFGIFLVLSILMIGMILAGKIFLYFEKKIRKEGKIISGPAKTASEGIKPAATDEEILPEQASAIATALHLHLAAPQSPEPMHLHLSRITSWTQQGREQIMSERFRVFNREDK